MIKSLRRYIDQLPFELTIEYYQSRDAHAGYIDDDYINRKEISSPELWDSLRRQHPLFSIPNEREEWVEMCEANIGKDGIDKLLKTRASEIMDILKARSLTNIFSVGSGAAALEYHLKKLWPDVKLACSDYAPATVKMLRNVFEECDTICQFDILGKDWLIPDNVDNQVVMINRLDSLFTDAQWQMIFHNAHQKKVDTILYITSHVLTLRSLVATKKRYYRDRLSRKPLIFVAWIRTQKVFKKYWNAGYRSEKYALGGSTAYLLTRR